MKIVIVGAGGVGGYFGGLLALAGHDIGFVARGETLAALNSRGLRLANQDGQRTVTRCIAGERAAEVADRLGGVDVVIVATKALAGNSTFADVDTLSDVPVVTTHNSVEVHFTAADLFGAERVLAGVVRGYMTRTGPAEITLNPGPLSLNFGLMPGVFEAPSALPLVDALRDAGIDSRYFGPDGAVLVDVWSKAMFVATTGVLGAVAGKPLGYLRAKLRPQLRGLMEEVAAVGCASGVPLPASIVEDTLAFCDAQYPEATSSMHRDIAAGMPSELDAQVGALLRVAKRCDVDTPLLGMVHALALAR
ncbi:2-dehydropantoate 2-reductase [Corynebacterium liangguodongii]|uniref:2-dehydropantoate 2-reductase n=1 Tax=Corynebacterium liangguodongii TaxID=2079535 RepID=A0A2S0WF53_9CORY|nr:2-dehydropantoate 2-reductase [Corynebacterium liangguodongii]AWB84398.1 2-dehydropantoate 2-reductase [Corynebacterium liangguodongii]PWB99888.1 2-dehydropantoate 2-reductase [Corynebacterium liangguodongii]